MKSSIVLCYGINKMTYLRILSTCYIRYCESDYGVRYRSLYVRLGSSVLIVVVTALTIGLLVLTAGLVVLTRYN